MNYSIIGIDDVLARSQSNEHINGMHNVPKVMPKTKTNVHKCVMPCVQASAVYAVHANIANAQKYANVV